MTGPARILAIAALATTTAGCLSQFVPAHDPLPDDETDKTAVGTPIYDMAESYAPDPTSDGGVPVTFADIQKQFDTMGCTTSQCHGAGAGQAPVLTATPASDVALRANYFDLLDGCETGAPDPANCVDTHSAAKSLLLAKTCATSGTDHAGGKPFADDSDPTYKQWQAWIAAGAPYANAATASQ